MSLAGNREWREEQELGTFHLERGLAGIVFEGEIRHSKHRWSFLSQLVLFCLFKIHNNEKTLFCFLNPYVSQIPNVET